MSGGCSSCGVSNAETVRAIELPSDARSDDIRVSLQRCGTCGRRWVWVYEESRRGALFDESWDAYEVSCDDDGWHALDALVAGCPAPNDRRCRCRAHRQLGTRSSSGRWNGLDGYRPAPETSPTPTARIDVSRWRPLAESLLALTHAGVEWAAGDDDVRDHAFMARLEPGRREMARRARDAEHAANELAASLSGEANASAEVTAAKAVAKVANAVVVIAEVEIEAGFDAFAAAAAAPDELVATRRAAREAAELAELAAGLLGDLLVPMLSAALRFVGAACRSIDEASSIRACRVFGFARRACEAAVEEAGGVVVRQPFPVPPAAPEKEPVANVTPRVSLSLLTHAQSLQDRIADPSASDAMIEECVEQLETMVRETMVGEPDERRAMVLCDLARALGEAARRSASACPVLVELLSDDSSHDVGGYDPWFEQVCEVAAESLHASRRAGPALVAGLDHQSAVGRYWAARLLAAYPDQRASSELRLEALIHDAHDRVARQAAETLARYRAGDDNRVERARQQLQSPDPHIQFAGIAAWRELAYDERVPMLPELLPLLEPEGPVSLHAAAALMLVADAAEPALEALRRLLGDSREPVRWQAKNTLAVVAPDGGSSDESGERVR